MNIASQIAFQNLFVHCIKIKARLSELQLYPNFGSRYLFCILTCKGFSNWNFSSTLLEKCPNTEFFLLRIFPYLDWIRNKSPYLVRIRENTDHKQLRIWTLFTRCIFSEVKYTTPFFLYKHERKFTPASIMLSFLRISGSDYAYDMLNISFLRKFWK